MGAGLANPELLPLPILVILLLLYLLRSYTRTLVALPCRLARALLRAMTRFATPPSNRDFEPRDQHISSGAYALPTALHRTPTASAPSRT